MGLLGLRLLRQPFFMPIVPIMTYGVEAEKFSLGANVYLANTSKCVDFYRCARLLSRNDVWSERLLREILIKHKTLFLLQAILFIFYPFKLG